MNFGYRLMCAGTLFILIAYMFYLFIGINIDSAVAQNNYTTYLDRSHAVHEILVLQISLGMIGFFITSIGMNLVGHLIIEKLNIALFLRHSNTVATGLIIVAGFGLLAINTKLFSGTLDGHELLFQVLGWFFSRTFWISMILFFGVNALIFSIFSKPNSFPDWHRIFGIIITILALSTLISFITHKLDSYGSWLFPAGLLWLIISDLILKRSIQNFLA